MKKTKILSVIIIAIVTGCGNGIVKNNTLNSEESEFLNKKLELAYDYYETIVSDYQKDGNIPYSFSEGEYQTTTPSGWTSGFFSGILWYLYESSRKDLFKEQAEYFTQLLEDEQYKTNTHDLGFIMYCSYGNGYRLTKNERYKKILIKSAESLSERYSPVIGCVRSWDFPGWWQQFPVIIDNMMNLELLMWAGKNSKNEGLSHIAVNHAMTTMKNQYMDDYCSYHVVDYDTVSGKVIKKGTFQGAHDESSWARGQAWGLYGYTMMYRESGQKKFLEQAENIAGYIIPKLDDNSIPCWDLALRDRKDEERDASAAAIIASALIELYTLSGNAYYLETGKKIIMSLSSPEYFSIENENGGFLLKHSVVFKPAGLDLDIPLVYTDYYYIEAITRLLSI